MKKITSIALWMWQLPQHIVAGAVWLALKITGNIRNISDTELSEPGTVPSENTVFIHARRWSVALGKYLFLCSYAELPTLMHEVGHSIQSRYWGPLYLITVGIPSAVFNGLWDELMHKKWTAQRRRDWYFSRYPEAGADKLGNVCR